MSYTSVVMNVFDASVVRWLERKDTNNLLISQNIKICISMHLTGWLKKENQEVYRADGKTVTMLFYGGWTMKTLRDKWIYLILLEVNNTRQPIIIR